MAPEGWRTRILDEGWVKKLASDFHIAVANIARAYVRTRSMKKDSDLYKLFVEACEAAELTPDLKSLDCWDAFKETFFEAMQTTDHVGSIDIWLIAGESLARQFICSMCYY